MGRNGLRKKITRSTDYHDDVRSSKEVLLTQHVEEDGYHTEVRSSSKEANAEDNFLNQLTEEDSYHGEVRNSKKTNAKDNFLTQQAEEDVYLGSVDNRTISYHYGGYFIFSPSRKYVRGQLIQQSDLDVDFISFFDILDHLKVHCKFNIMEGDKFFYLRGDRDISDYDGLVECRDDSDVMRMIDTYKMHKEKPIEIYTLPKNCDVFMSNSLGENSHGDHVYEEMSEPIVEGESSDGVETNTAGSNVVKRKTRGRTRCVKIINLEEGEKLLVEFDKDHQAIGENATQFIWFLGQTVRSRACCPLKVRGWREIEQNKIDDMWDIILEKFTFDVSEKRKGAILGHMSDLYRDYRHKLKRAYFDSKSTYQLRLRNKPKHIYADEWKYLVNLWSDAQFQRRSMQNKANRSKRSLPPYIGTKSHARFREDWEKKHGEAPSRVDVFIETRKRKNGKQVDAFQEDVVVQLEQLKKQRKEGEISLNDDDIFEKVLGAEKNGYLRAYGPGKSISEYFGGRPTKVQLMKQVEATRKEANERVEEVKREAREQVEGIKKEMENKLEEHDRRWEGKIQRILAAIGQERFNNAYQNFMEEP